MKKKIIPYYPKLKERARYLRNNSTLSEILVWKQIKKKQLKGFDFHRQKPINIYIVVFFCPDLMLAIEIDGDSHRDERLDEDKNRQKKLEGFGITFLRFLDRMLNRTCKALCYQ